MAVTLGTNISSLRALRSLDRSSTTLSKVFERLSSGARINRAADDAAGLAVSMSLSNRARVLSRSDKNLQDGLSAVNIADGAFEQVSNTLSRMAELAEQASNGSLSRFQRMALHQEYKGLSDEIRRISETTTFNGLSLLKSGKSANIGTELQPADTAGNYMVVATSGDGRYALTSDDTNIYLYDRQSSAYTTLGAVVLSGGSPLATMDSSGNVVFSDGQNLFRFDIYTRRSTQITNSSIATTYSDLAISADGSRLAFFSATQFGDGNSLATAVSASGATRLYAVDLSGASNTVRRISQPTIPIFAPRLTLSSDGSKLFFISNSNLTGQNADANYEVFGTDLSRASISLTQVTNTSGAGGDIGIFGGTIRAFNDGRVLIVDTRNYSGQNPTGARQLFFGSLNGGSVQQYSNYALSTSFTSLTVSADESSLFFMSQDNITGENPSGANQAYRIDLANGVTSQLSNWNAVENETPTAGVFSGDGRVIWGNVAGQYTSNYGYRVIDLSTNQSLIDISTGNGRQGGVGVAFADLRATLEGIGGYTLTSAASARGALDSVQRTIQNLATARGQLGAGGARLETALRVVQSQVQESRAANSRIVDADIASESAQLTRTQILQQAGSAVLAQANQQPALVLSLLRI